MHDLGAEGGQATVARRLGLDVAQLVHSVVNESDRTHSSAVRSAQGIRLTVAEVCALTTNDRGGATFVVRCLDVRGVQDGFDLRVGEQAGDASELSVVVGPGLARTKRPVRTQASRRINTEHREVGHRSDATAVT